MKKLTILLALLAFSDQIFAQANTTETLQKNSENRVFFFYKNTLRMVNQIDNKEFDELIKDIDKLKLVIVDKPASKIEASNYKQLKQNYQSERYDAVMTSRYQGRNFDILFNEKKGGKPGTVILVNDSSTLYVLDIVGTIDVSKVGPFFSQLNESSDLGAKIQEFVGRKNRHHNFDEDENKKDNKKSDH